MDIHAVVPLDAESLLVSAKRATGLSDFGSDTWRQPFEILARALDEEANLNLMGRLMCRSDMLNFLEGRLRIEETYRAHPEINDEKIIKPFIIAGQGRSGTSALLNLISMDPDIGSVKTWEAIFPCPPPKKANYDSDPRVERGHALISQWNRVNPGIEATHEFGGEIPASCVHFMTYNFMSIWFDMLGRVPSYAKYCATADWHDTFEYHKRILKLLQWKNPRKRWILKSPTHLQVMPTILDVYPDACFIWPHRDPLKAIVSSIDMAGNLLWARSDDVHVQGFEDYNRPDRTVAMLERPIEWLENGQIPRERLCNVNYVEFIDDPIGTVEKIYTYFDAALSDRARDAMAQYMRESPRSARPVHQYDSKTTQVLAGARNVFRRYQQYFDVPSEI